MFLVFVALATLIKKRVIISHTMQGRQHNKRNNLKHKETKEASLKSHVMSCMASVGCIVPVRQADMLKRVRLCEGITCFDSMVLASATET